MAHAFPTATHTNTAETNKTLADPLRVSIVEALGHAEMSLGELAEVFNLDERLMLYHLRRLVRAGAIVEHRMGMYTSYEVDNPTVAAACHILYELWIAEASRSHSRQAVTV